ncbi:MAG: dimethyl sulfoxide reductase anchor subunit [Gammaproteobacteria bacterium]|nr:dimethyl sulfoxide reductase anchor subunit [Gammaproteobacteria bacterium]
MFQPRPKEQKYAWVPHVAHPEKNRYGTSIETVPEGHALRGQSLNINGDAAVFDNPNRYKQHGFYFNADRCISCHACEAACSEKNDLPPHLAFRSVGYLEGGTYPAYTRINISMACNHCDDPVCLKGCPTRAYTKFAEYGAVLQDPDICFGCGYCTWVCPYNAPQLDTKAGHVSKCNMCVDRLEVGLKPACASACLAGALDFGIVETTPEDRHQLEARIPGFPTPDISHPNIRFQQVNSLPRELRRTDSMPLRYERDEQGEGGEYVAKVADDGRPMRWNLKGLSTRENPLVIFTLVTQAVVGAFITLFVGPQFGVAVPTPATHPVAWPLMLFALLGIQTLALVLSTMHLGRPHRFYRAFNNLKFSPVSREVAGVAVFYNLLGVYAVSAGLPQLTGWLPAAFVDGLVVLSGWAATVAGLVALYFMHRIYRIPARPYWNHWQVLTSFYGSMLTLGCLLVAVFTAVVAWQTGQPYAATVSALSVPVAIGLVIDMVGLWRHAHDLGRGPGEAQAGHFLQLTDFGKTYRARNVMLAAALAAVVAIGYLGPEGGAGVLAWSVLALVVTIAALAGRAIFYAVVVPTTMPGAFFWKNAGFQQHARETGLAEMPQVGVLADSH